MDGTKTASAAVTGDAIDHNNGNVPGKKKSA
jgi:hypothetical protein